MSLWFLLGLVIGYAVSFLCTAAMIKVICWAFGLTFAWKTALGIWMVLTLLWSFFGRIGK